MKNETRQENDDVTALKHGDRITVSNWGKTVYLDARSSPIGEFHLNMLEYGDSRKANVTVKYGQRVLINNKVYKTIVDSYGGGSLDFELENVRSPDYLFEKFSQMDEKDQIRFSRKMQQRQDQMKIRVIEERKKTLENLVKETDENGEPYFSKEYLEKLLCLEK